MAKILITGTNSYIGNSMKTYIDKKNASMPADNAWHVTFVSVRNEEWKQLDFSSYDAILHVAGIVHRKEQKDMWELYHQVNTVLTEELAEKAKQEKTGQFLFLSTMSVYGKVTGAIDAKTPPAPVNFYGKSKWMAEQELEKMSCETFPVAIIRPPMIYGKNCTGNYRLLEKLAKKTPIFPKVNNQRSMLYIDNLCECLYQIIEKKASGFFCPQNREYVNTSRLVQLIGKTYGKKIHLVPGFSGVIKLLSKRVSLFSKVFGSLIYEKSLSQKEQIGNYNCVEFGESIYGSKDETINSHVGVS